MGLDTHLYLDLKKEKHIDLINGYSNYMTATLNVFVSNDFSKALTDP